MALRIADVVDDSVVDGAGIRLTVFLQGCPHRCPGCHNPSTHDVNGGRLIEEDEIIGLIRENPLLTGVTFSGGEPLLQAAELVPLAKKVKAMGLNIWCYTGYVYEDLVEKNDPDVMALLAEADVLVDGPYLEKERDLTLKFRGSRNQRLIDLGETRKQKKIVLAKE